MANFSKDWFDDLVITDESLLDCVSNDDYDDYYEAFNLPEDETKVVSESTLTAARHILEEFEDEVECCKCGELFPKDSSVKLETGDYICGRCYNDETKKVEAEDAAEVTAPCSWCGQEYPIDEMRQEIDLGWLCDRCEQAIKSRGEELIFKEGCNCEDGHCDGNCKDHKE